MSTTRERIKEILLAAKDGHPADALLKAFVIIPRDDLPTATPNEAIGAVEVEGVDHSVWPLTTSTGHQAYKDALEYLAAYSVIEHWTSKQEVLKRNKAKRRDELATEFTAVNSYGGQLPYTQKLIDRIIELEKKAS